MHSSARGDKRWAEIRVISRFVKSKKGSIFPVMTPGRLLLVVLRVIMVLVMVFILKGLIRVRSQQRSPLSKMIIADMIRTSRI